MPVRPERTKRTGCSSCRRALPGYRLPMTTTQPSSSFMLGLFALMGVTVFALTCAMLAGVAYLNSLFGGGVHTFEIGLGLAVTLLAGGFAFALSRCR